MAKKKAKIGRPPRGKKTAARKIEIRCTDDEFNRYNRLATRYTAGDRSTLMRVAVDEYEQRRKVKRALRKRRTTGNIVRDTFAVLFLFIVLIVFFGVPTVDPEIRERKRQELMTTTTTEIETDETRIPSP